MSPGTGPKAASSRRRAEQRREARAPRSSKQKGDPKATHETHRAKADAPKRKPEREEPRGTTDRPGRRGQNI